MSDGASRAGDWQAALALVERLLDLPPGEREAALRAGAATPDIRELAARMLAADRQPSVLDMPLANVPAGDTGPTDLVGRRIGRWLLTGLLGHGGMSVVYRARSLTPPAGQEAALKLLSMAAATAAGRARFGREIEILVRLRHPGIAPLHEAGVAADGTPWFAMALVEGIDIATWCREQGPGVAQRVELLLQVCDAVAHAHRHLVIHRDIKPSNVMVDAEGRAILLDFGISRMLEAGAADVTGTGTYAFTPRYAAPEQIAGGAITTATDVYGLGSLLHLLLLGGAPQFPAHAPDAECVHPATLARREGDRALRKALSGDLGEILHKSLARDPARRYPGASELATDLRAWKAGEPVAARQGGRAYRMRRFVARHRLPVALGTGMVLALAVGAALALWQRQEALHQAGQARAAANSSMRQLAFLRTLLDMLVPSNEAEAAMGREAVIGEAARRARTELSGQPVELAAVQVQLGRLYRRIGRFDEAEQLLDQAMDLAEGNGGFGVPQRVEILLARAQLMTDRKQDPERAEAYYREAIAMLSAVRGSLEQWQSAKRSYAVHLGNRGDYDDALSQVRDALSHCDEAVATSMECQLLHYQLGTIYGHQGRVGEAIGQLERAERGLRDHHPSAQTTWFVVVRALAAAYAQVGRYAQAVDLLRDMLDSHARVFGRPTVDSIQALTTLADALDRLGLFDQAVDAAKQAMEQAASIHGASSSQYANAVTALGNARYRYGDWSGALEDYRRSHALMLEIHGAEHAAVAIAEGNVGNALRDGGDARAALPWQRAATERMARTLGTDSRRYAARLSNLARTRFALGQLDQARAGFDRAIELYRRHGSEDDFAPHYIRANRALVRAAQGETRQARLDVLEGMEGVVASQGARSGMALESLAWALTLHCRPAPSADCAPLRRRAQAVLQEQAALPPLERRMLSAALADD
ncbi:tetratricopeptide repeat protein [Luteimonas viscosa]|uniref:Tetratricopeptide repeat protein n=1 Tax=Luteimonas viscosa TaxID=1132694 RepID=A0A5D4XN23_9GAMM|nr:serine/threonine-protein kinase [Luteimonas viscosa]TYT26046.1 tetratricopeptide repeat protein [Luteimonas viscosa]